MSRRSLAALLLAAPGLLFLGGCGATEIHSIMFKTAAGGSQEAALYIETVPSRPFIEVGILQAIGTGDQATTPNVLAALRQEGRRQGCDAIVLARAARGRLSAHASGMCVVWATPSPAPTP